MRRRRIPGISTELLSVIIKTMQETKGSDILSMNLNEIQNSVTDYFVICHANSKTQVNAIADHIIDNVQAESGTKPYHFEGFENSEWILIDYVDIVVHVFLNTTRAFYQLEDLWADCEIVTYND